MKLMPGTIIYEHRDTFKEVSNSAFGQVRLHIPIITNDKVTFRVDGTHYHLSEGWLIYVNFSKKYYVRNDGEEPRTHLVFDLQVYELLKIFPPKLTLMKKLEMEVSKVLIPIFIGFHLKLEMYFFDSSGEMIMVMKWHS
ncbi:MAG: aspartyl/asparaginyl beta-hydroxylase domain-containing protein [Pseudomonadales bacterium]|nr:aspartyl/asparaginyl beta-hydroxylase domain-containing protein [Pseudomonadales bacterium]